MADVQLEHGSTKIANELFQALYRADFTALERRVIDVVINLTYTEQKTRAKISAHDIRLMLGLLNKNRTDRIQKTLNKLVAQNVLFNQRLVNNEQIIGIQKDYEKWLVWNSKSDKMCRPKEDSIYITKLTNITIRSSDDKMSLSGTSPYRLLTGYALEVFQTNLPAKNIGIETGVAKEMYQQALHKTSDPSLAYWLVKDYIDHLASDKWVKQHVKMVLTYGRRYFARYLSAYPKKKPRTVQLDEQTTGYRFKYDVVKERWVRTDERLPEAS